MIDPKDKARQEWEAFWKANPPAGRDEPEPPIDLNVKLSPEERKKLEDFWGGIFGE